MHYVRKITQDKYDVRSRTWFVYKCSCCGEEKWFPWTQNFNSDLLRTCPTCKVEDDTSNFEYLIRQKQSLEQQFQTVSCQLREVTQKLHSLQEAVEQKEAVCEPVHQ